MNDEQDKHGLDLFDETASAVRGFPNAMLGYDKKAVDDYIRDLERQLSLAKHQLREVQRELTAANLRVDDTDFSKLGAHTANLLKVAEAQANDLVNQARSRAASMVEEARAEADRTRAEAAQTAEDARQEGIASLKVLRDDLDRQTTAELEAARTEASGLREAADQHRTTVLSDAAQQSAATLEQARHEADRIVEAARSEAAEITARANRERESSLAEHQAEHARLTEEITAATTAARQHSEQLQESLATASTELRARVQASHAEAEQIKAQAISEAAQIVASAKLDAETRLQESDRELSSRRDKLTTEIGHLRRRKQHLLTQLAQFSSLATETASEFPEDDNGSSETAPASTEARETE